ncbi:hypothetical protein [Roseofilum casamattae]|uniref:Uncharacterized protein n=1 Tax=Roseofilum casamattae BLCC-M143 TaxID=3022442 RepID=A0ABT7BR87_9CYAN|nr:hypothetical protein [Roseofilum casamattae]MDJ1181698.1 hypothetical protein [Roseofilum casamattae BLCC-M143]
MSQWLNRLLIATAAIALAIWILRGVGVLTFLPGGIILFLTIAAIALGLLQLSQARF